MIAPPPVTILFGGSFDPVHEGHLKTAEALRLALGLSSVTLLPAARSPLKPAGTPDSHRLSMLQRAIVDYPGLLVDDRELRRPPPSYSVDTLRELRAEIGSDWPLGWVIGTDTLQGLSQWKDWQQLTESGASSGGGAPPCQLAHTRRCCRLAGHPAIRDQRGSVTMLSSWKTVAAGTATTTLFLHCHPRRTEPARQRFNQT
jgi:cytidyltransferase-like protein